MPGECDCVIHLTRVAADRNLSLHETLALGLLVAREWDRAGSADATTLPQSAEATAKHDNLTNAELFEFRSTASRMLAEYAASLRYAPRPRPSWWTGVAQSPVAALLYSVFLAMVFFVIKLAGSDALTVLRSLLAER